MIEQEELNEKFLDFGALGYSDERIASILAIDVKEVHKMMQGEMGSVYQTGKDRFDYTVDKKLMEHAAQGDLKALAKKEAREKMYKRIKQ